MLALTWPGDDSSCICKAFPCRVANRGRGQSKSTTLGDAVTTSPGGQFIIEGLILVPALLFLRVLARTHPGRKMPGLSRFERAIAPWLWTRERTRRKTVLAFVASSGAIICCVASLLPMVTFTSVPLFPGDPFAGPMEADPIARGLALTLGAVILLLALHRVVGGQGYTAPIALMAATGLSCVAVLALTDYIGNDHLARSAGSISASAGAGLFLLIVGSVVAWLGSGLEVLTAVRSSLRGQLTHEPGADGDLHGTVT